MRWSLILSTSLTVLSTFSAALVIPSAESLVDLERRGPGAKDSSKVYRKKAEDHDYAYKFDHTGAVTREKLQPGERSAKGKLRLLIPKTDADHVFEHQMLNNHLEKHGLKYNELHADLKKEVKGILNDPKNMAPIPAKVNRGKGQLIKQGLAGKALKKANPSRDQYTLLSYGSARRTAKQLDAAFEKHGHKFGDKTFHKTLRTTMENAKILHPGDPSPKSSHHGSSRSSSVHGSDHGSVHGSVHGSDHGSIHGSHHGSEHGSTKTPSNHGSHASVKSPRKSIVVGGRKPKIALATRRSTRIAAIKRKGKK